MPTMDATAEAALATPAFACAYFIYIDLLGDPLRFTTFGAETVVSGSGDSELDGTYPAFGGRLIEVGDVNNSDSGSDTMTLTLSGIITMDTALLNEIGDRTQWQGRVARIWCRLYDETGVTAQGAIFPLYTGYMSSVKIIAQPEQQTIQLSIENWRAAFNQPSNRTYLGQKDYDATDTSAAATIAASNGMRRDTGAGAAVPGAPGSQHGGAGNGLTGNGIGGSYDSLSSDAIAPSYINTV